MKNILSIVFILVCAIGYSQDPFPTKQSIGSNKTEVYSKGALGSDSGYVYRYNFPDTTAANFGTLKNKPNIVILANDTLWKRNNAATRWDKLGGGGGSDLSEAEVMSAVTDIAAFNNATRQAIVVTDDESGGIFKRYVGGDAADGGMVFTDGGGGKWKRQVTDNNISHRYYGATAAASAALNFAAITGALNYVWAHPTEELWLYLPKDGTGAGTYAVSEQIKITQATNIRGDGDLTKLQFPFNSRGFFFQEYNSDFTCIMKDFTLANASSGSAIDSTKSLIEVRCKVLFENINVTYSSGKAFSFIGTLSADSTTNKEFGNPSFSIVRNCFASFSLMGFFAKGSDANYIDFYSNDARQNKRWGFYDSSLLGCNFYSARTHANSNASLTGAKTTVTYLGLYYSASVLHDDGSGVGKDPVAFPTYWLPTSAIAATAWDAGTHYWSGGSRISAHPSGTSQWFAPYDEGDQAQPVMNSRSLTFGGIRGIGTPAGTIYRDQNLTEIKGGLHTDVGISIGLDAAPAFSLEIEDASYKQIGIKSTGVTSSLGMNNSSGLEGGIQLTGAELIATAGGAGAWTASLTKFSPYSLDGIQDLGVAGLRWRKIFANLSAGTGHKSVRLNTTTGELVAGDTLVVDNFFMRNTGTTGDSILIPINASTAGFKKLIATSPITITPADSTLTIACPTCGTGSGVTTMAAIGSSPNANGATISGSTLNLEPASGSFGGVVTTGTQTIAGAKTFTGNSFFTSTGTPLTIGNGTGSLTIAFPSPAPELTSSHDAYFKACTGCKFYIGRANRINFMTDGTGVAIGNGYLGSSPPSDGLLVEGNVGIGITSTTAALHLKAGTATASTAPLKLTTGTSLTTPEAGAVEFDGTNYFATSSTTRYTLAKTLMATATLDFGSTVAGTSSDLTVTVTGAADGDAVSIGVPNGSTLSNGIFTAWISATNTVTIRFSNNSLAATLDPASGSFRVSVIKY